jgi:hypothetical protein
MEPLRQPLKVWRSHRVIVRVQSVKPSQLKFPLAIVVAVAQHLSPLLLALSSTLFKGYRRFGCD